MRACAYVRPPAVLLACLLACLHVISCPLDLERTLVQPSVEHGRIRLRAWYRRGLPHLTSWRNMVLVNTPQSLRFFDPMNRRLDANQVLTSELSLVSQFKLLWFVMLHQTR